MKQTLLLIAAVAARKVFWTRVEELLDNVNESLEDAQTFIEEEIQPQIGTMEDIVDTSAEM